MMKKLTVTVVLGLALISSTAVSAAAQDSTPGARTLPWTTVSELESHLVRASVVGGCDPRPMGFYVATHGADTYYVVVSADQRWVIVRPVDVDGRAWIWYGTITGTERLLVERALLGTSDTDVCPFLTRHSA